jgi:hypothetical protein
LPLSQAPHLIGRLDLEVAVADLDAAMALRPRLEDLGWRLMPQVLERVFDALAPAGLQLKLGRLELDLGRVGPVHLEADALAALERALSEALVRAIVTARDHASDAARLLTLPALALERLETCLTTGIMPLAGPDTPLDLTEQLQALIETQPQALVAMLRRRAGERQVLERLALQLGQTGLESLLTILAPAEASVILALMAEVVLAHRPEPLASLVRLSEPALRRLMWEAALAFLLRDAGTQFNRRRFLAALLRHEARRHGLDYDALIRLLRVSVGRVGTKTPFRSSLPVTLAELLQEAPPTETAADAQARSLAAAGADPFAAAREGDFDLLLNMVRRRATDRPQLAALVRRLDRPLFAGLVERLESANAGLILAYMDDLAGLHRAEPLVDRSDTGFERLIRLLTLQYLLRDPGGEFNRRAWLGQLIVQIAVEGSIPYEVLIRELVRAVEELRAHRPLAGGLAAAVLALAGAFPASAPRARGEDAPLTADQIARRLEVAGRSEAASLLARVTATPGLLARVAGRLGETGRHHLLELIDPGRADGIIADLDLLGGLHAVARLTDLDSGRFETLTFGLALAWLAGPGRRRRGTDRRDLWRWLLERIAHHEATPPADLAAGVRRSLQSLGPEAEAPAADSSLARLEAAARDLDAVGDTGVHPIGDPRRLIEHFLRTGEPLQGGRDLPALAGKDGAWLADLVRRLARVTASDVPALLDRLLYWLTPEELLECLAPGQATLTRRWSDGLGGGDLPAWRPVLETLLSNAAPARRPTSGVGGGAGSRLDRLALLAHWLDYGTWPWWAPGPETSARALADLPEMTLPELTWLFAGRAPDHTLARLQRAVIALPPAQTTALIERLAPWATKVGGPLTTVLAGLDEARQREVRLRAAAAALEGDSLDFSGLAVPVAPLPAEPLPPPPVTAGAATIERLLAWLDGAEASVAEAARLNRLFARLADGGDAALVAHLTERRRTPQTRARWAAILPPETLGRVVHIVAPARARAGLDAMLVLAAAWRQIAPFGAPRPPPEQLWRTLLDLMAGPEAADGVGVIEGLIAALTGGGAGPGLKLRARAERLAREGGYASVAANLRRSGPSNPRVPPRGRGREPGHQEPPPPAKGQAAPIGNAGLVLLSPYLPSLFDRLKLLTPGETGRPRIEGAETISRAVHLLQYLADGRLDAPEPLLVLNKLLCGLSPATPVARSLEADPADLDLCDGLLRAVIANWPMIGAASPAGLRETFLSRTGRLLRGDARWGLRVQRKTLDILVDHIPWSFALVYHRWMVEPIDVTW